jgi:hypothetical protein
MPDEQTTIDDRTNGGKEVSQEAYAALQSFVSGPDLLEKSFTQQEVITAVQMLVDPGNDISNLTMRADFPDSQFLKAAARHLARCRRFKYKAGEEELKFIVAGFPGIKGKRADMLVNAVVGEKKQQRESFGDTVKRALHL